MSTAILKQSLDALERQAKHIRSMEQRHGNVNYHNSQLCIDVAKVSTVLRRAIDCDDKLEAAQAAGARVQALELGDLRISRENPPRYPEAWQVRNAYGLVLSRDGAMDQLPATITPEWTTAHYFHNADQALAAAVEYLGAKGGAA